MRVRLSTALAAVLVFLTGCGGGQDPRPPSRTAANGDVFNSADVRFASDMVVHHAQALQLIDMLREHASSGALQDLGERLLDQQPPQTEQMVDWLSDWDQELPETPMDHTNADDNGGMLLTGDEMPGLLSSDEVGELEKLTGTAFARRWAELMAEQQQGAVDMAATETDRGMFKPALKLAAAVADQHANTVELLETFN
jgi:uncharacterized protein (DUF305 family)